MIHDEKIHIAIVGAGIGGLVLSVALGYLDKEQKFDIQIYEASKHVTEIGAGINFWPRTWEIIKSIGLEETLLKLLPNPPDDLPRIGFHIRKGDQRKGVHIQDLTMKGAVVRFHRAALQQALASHMAGKLKLSHRLVSYEETNEAVNLHFQDKSTATCDLLIGMDGIKSAVRRQLLEKTPSCSPSLDPVWSGMFAYRGLIPVDLLQEEFPSHRALTTPIIYCGKSKHIVVYRVSQDRFVNVAAFVADYSKEGSIYPSPTTTACPQNEVLSAFRLWEPEVQALFRCIKEPTKWAIQSLEPLDIFSTGRVILAGDAAHAMTPHQGSGAGQAVEDAYVLAALLSHKLCNKSNLSLIGKVYDQIRRPVANRVLAASCISGKLCGLVAPGFEDVEEGDAYVPFEKLTKLIDDFGKGMEWVWKESAEDDKRRAIGILEHLGTGEDVSYV